MEFRILGEVEVRDGDRLLVLHGRRERALLAYLLIHANEVVPTERLIEQVWGESPPPTVATALHVYISRLRKVLGENGSAIVTRTPGYVLVVDPEHVDAQRFERLVAAGRSALGEGEAARAAQMLRDALALWHGTPLADVIEPEWAESEIRRLQELRLSAIEDRIEADLQLGRHADLVSELEGLVARNPLRERLRAQLMLALYRCDRQSDALQLYRETRRMLAEELGIEPSSSLRRLEQAILSQDPALDSPQPDEPNQLRRPRRRRLTFVLAALAIAAVTVALVAVIVPGGSAVVVVRDSVAVIDMADNRVVSDIPLGGTPAAIAAGAGAVWVADHDDGTVVRIDPDGERTRAIAVGFEPRSVTATSNAVWVADGQNLVRIDARYRNVTAKTTLRQKTARFGPDDAGPGSPGAVATGPAGLWVAHGISAVSTIVPASLKVTRTISLADVPLGLAVAKDAIWIVAPPTNRLISIDPSTGKVMGTAEVPELNYGHAGAYAATAIAVDRRSVWLPTGDRVTRVDRFGLETIASIPTAGATLGIAIGGGSVWVSNNLAGTVSRIDPKTNQVVATIEVGGNPGWIAVTPNRVWVTIT